MRLFPWFTDFVKISEQILHKNLQPQRARMIDLWSYLNKGIELSNRKTSLVFFAVDTGRIMLTFCMRRRTYLFVLRIISSVYFKRTTPFNLSSIINAQRHVCIYCLLIGCLFCLGRELSSRKRHSHIKWKFMGQH